MSDPQPLPAESKRNRGRVLSDAEVSSILERAADIQERSEGRLASGQGVTIEDLREIAREAGIDPQFVDIAIEQGRGALEPLKHPLVGAYSWRFHTEIPGTLTAEARSRLVQEVRFLLEEQGQVSEIYGRTEWRHDDSMGPVTVSVFPKDGSVAIDVAANRKGEAGLLVGLSTFLGTMPGGLLVGTVLNSIVGLDENAAVIAAVFAVSGAASYALSRTIWQMRSAWWARRLRQMSDRVSSLVQDLAQASDAAGKDRVGRDG